MTLISCAWVLSNFVPLRIALISPFLPSNTLFVSWALRDETTNGCLGDLLAILVSLPLLWNQGWREENLLSATSLWCALWCTTRDLLISFDVRLLSTGKNADKQNKTKQKKRRKKLPNREEDPPKSQQPYNKSRKTTISHRILFSQSDWHYFSPNSREFTQRPWGRLRKRCLKSEFALPQTLIALFHLV